MQHASPSTRTSLAFAALLLASCSALPAAQASTPQESAPEIDQRVSLYLGVRGFDEDEWELVDDHGVVAFDYSSESEGSPVGWEIGLALSRSDDDEFVEAATGEVYGGIRKTFGSGRLRPELGAGVSAIRAGIDVDGAGDDSDASLALYAHGGIGVVVGSNVLLGIDARVLFGSDVELEGIDTDADYGQLALVVGIGI